MHVLVCNTNVFHVAVCDLISKFSVLLFQRKISTSASTVFIYDTKISVFEFYD